MLYLLKTNEIILKRRNRRYFERVLERNIKAKLKENFISLKNWGGVFLLETKKESEEDIGKIFGISHFSPVFSFSSLEELIEYLKKIDEERFYLEVSRGDKDYPLNSLEIKKTIIENLEKVSKKYDKENFEKEIYVYYKRKNFFVSFKNIKSWGGLPVGSNGKALSLISSGFDSPVASFLAMKRGLKVFFLHFHSYPQTSLESLEKVKKLVSVLNDYNLGSELYLMNILEIQKFYFLNVPHEYLVIFYRRSMFRLAERLKNELNLDVLITGENLGQVASQTTKNLEVISQSINSLILRPLIAFNKEEIINLARKIGTESISKMKGDDCCTLFVPRNVKTRANLKEVLEIEEKIKEKIISLEEETFKNKEKLIYN